MKRAVRGVWGEGGAGLYTLDILCLLFVFLHDGGKDQLNLPRTLKCEGENGD